MKMQKLFSVVAVGSALLMGAFAQAGIVSETLTALGRQAAKYGGKLVPKALDDAARQSPTLGRLLQTYGDDVVVRVATHPGRMKSVAELGDDAAEAFLKHGTIADKVLHHCPDRAVASALGQMSTETGKWIGICANKHPLTRDGYKNLVLMVREGGEEVAQKLSKLSPDKFNQVLLTAQTVGLSAACGMVLATAAVSDSPMEFLNNLYDLCASAWEHPILVVLVAALVISLVAKFPSVVVSVLLWLPRLAIRALKGLWTLGRTFWLRYRANAGNS